MRFDQRVDGERCEFWLLDVDKSLEPALERLAWQQRPGGAWRRCFPAPAPAPGQADRAFENLQRLLVPMLRQSAGLAPVPWERALAQTCTRFSAADEPEPADFGPAAAACLETIRWRDWDIRVPPLRLQRRVSAARGLAGRVALIDQLGS